MRFVAKVCVVLMLVAAAASTARAEVAAVLNGSGDYECMTYRYGILNGVGRVWAINVANQSRRPLNTTGDLVGDLAPTVAENPVRANWPVAVWSRPYGGDFDLVYSSWDGTAWTPVRYVQPDTTFSEIEPRLAFSSVGQVYMVWWADERGVGAVYFSLLLDGGWAPPVRVSRRGVDSRRASLSIATDTLVRVSYQTPAGEESRDVLIVSSDTITDDIDPKLQVQITIGG